MSHRFWVVVFSFSFVSMHILISFFISSVICWLFLSVLFSFHMFVFFIAFFLFCSVQFHHSVMSDSLWPCELQHARPPCPSPTPGVHPNACPSSRWCHPAISSSVIPFSSCPQSFPASGSFPVSQFFASGGQNIGVSASTSVLPMNTQDWSPLAWTGGSPCSLRDSQESSPTPQFKSISSLVLNFLYGPTLTSILTTGKTIALTKWTFVGKVMSLLLNMLSRLVITFLPRSKRLLLSWLSHHLQWF